MRQIWRSYENMQKGANKMKNIQKVPHCDQKVIHAPKTCEICDKFPEWQELREVWGINFTGENDANKIQCPSETRRPLEIIEKWGGNRPVHSPTVETTNGKPVEEVLDAQRTQKEEGQHEGYLVLSKEERDKGFVRPYRHTYVHVGTLIKRHPDGRLYGRLIEADDPDYSKYASDYYALVKGYTAFVLYPADSGTTGRYITAEEVGAIKARKTHFGGCGFATKMARAIAETYARNPKFYGSTFCTGCQKHLPVSEFVWEDGVVLGS
jgi:hypothetical protein